MNITQYIGTVIIILAVWLLIDIRQFNRSLKELKKRQNMEKAIIRKEDEN